jgi:F-type H+-transporting ATPase subunit delta
VNRSTDGLAKRYANALLESAVETGVLEQTAQECESIIEIFKSLDLSLFSNPQLSLDSKKALLKEMFSVFLKNPFLERFFNLVLENGRFSAIHQILKTFVFLSDSKRGISRVELVGARKIPVDVLQVFEKTFNVNGSKKTILTHTTDPGLLAGYMVRIGNTLVDASLRSKLTSLKDALN